MENKKKTGFDILNEATERIKKTIPGYDPNFLFRQSDKVKSMDNLLKKEDKLTPEDEAAFLEGFNSIYEDDTPSKPSANIQNAVNSVKNSKPGDMLRQSVQNQKGDPNKPLIVQKLPHRPGNAQPEVVKYSNSASQSDIDKIKAAASNGMNWTKATLNGVLGVSNDIPDEMLQYRAPSITPSDLVNMKNAESKAGSATSQSQLSANENIPVAYWKEAPPWTSPAKETDDPIVKAGREYGTNILEEKFNQGWMYALGKEHVSDYSSPIYNSAYKDALIKSVKDNAKADFVAGVGASVQPIRDTVYNSVGTYGMFPKTGHPYVDMATLAGSILYGAYQTYYDDKLQGAIDTYNYLSENNARAKQSDGALEYLNNSEYKYLVDGEKSREKFIQTLKSEVEKLQNGGQLGYLSSGESDTVKREAINSLMRVIYLNENYDIYSKQRDKEIREAMKKY